jgi:putative transposase
VQAFGVTIEGMTYYAEALRPWINAEAPNAKGEKRKFIFRRDPRDISVVWFSDPALNQYYKVPFADQSLPPMSVWEYRQAREVLKRAGKDSVNEYQLLQTITELRSEVEKTKENTKKARRLAQRRKEHEKRVSPADPMPGRQSRAPGPALVPASGLVDGDIKPFGEIA